MAFLKSKKYEASIRVLCLKGARASEGDRDDHLRPSSSSGGRCPRLTVEIRWKGSKSNGFMAFSNKVKRDCTREEGVDQNGVVLWDEVFRSVCSFSGSSNKNGLYPWEVTFAVLKASDQGKKNKPIFAGPAVLNLAEFASFDHEQQLEISVPLILSSSVECFLKLFLTLQLREMRTKEEPPKSFHRSLTLPLSTSLSPCFQLPVTLEKEKSSIQKKSLGKARSLKEYILVSLSRRKSKKAHHGQPISDGKLTTGSESSEDNCSFYTYSSEYNNEALLEDNKEFSENVYGNSFGYGTLSSANLVGRMKRSSEDEDLVYYSNRMPESDSIFIDDIPSKTPEGSSKLKPKLQKMKRKMSFKSEKVKGEPLLKKENEERGGDDFDLIRWQHYSSDDLFIKGYKTESLMFSEFGDDSFAVGSWEDIEVMSRDGALKLETQVFFATIDQRSEKAAGESACTALVVVLAHWLHSNHNQMPIKSELDSLIREGSLQWRKLCEDKSFMARFPDKHFDLESVLEAKIRPISIVSTTGFFHPEGMEENEDIFGFLDGSRSFDCIWDEISTSESEPLIYIVSWNDHFFVLKVEVDAFYVIDTLGERLHEGCNRAYMLKFDKDTAILRVPTAQSSKEDSKGREASDQGVNEGSKVKEEETVVCRGKEACKEYIKSFLAAIPIKELQADIKEGRKRLKPLHELLQIDIHHTEFFSAPTDACCTAPGEAAIKAASVDGEELR